MDMLNEHDAPDGDEVVISGMSGEFPSASNMDELRDMLFKKEDMMKNTWGHENMGFSMKVGFIDNKEKFDTNYFGINKSLTVSMDPLGRRSLEHTFAAILDAGINPCSLSGQNVAVYMGSTYSECESNLCVNPKIKYSMLGHSRAMMANRVSYWLNVTGPSLSLMSMETSGFQVLEIAHQSILNGEVDTAIVGVASLTYTPALSTRFNDMGFISHDGKVKPFDEDADGYLQSEAVIVMLLQRARNANRIYASIVDVDVRYHGERNKLIDPYGEPLEHLMKSLYDLCGVNPVDVEYLEAEGNGIKKSDEEEMKAVDKVLLKNRKTPLLIGSVKSNMGQTQSCCNFSSIAKVVIAIQEGLLPPNINFNKPSSKIPALLENRAKVVCDITPWNLGYVAFNSMSMGSYAHVLLKPFKIKRKVTNSNGLPYLIIASSRTESSMQNVINKIQSMPENYEFISLMHNVFSHDIDKHLVRGYAIKEAGVNKISEIQHCDQSSHPIVWFIFSGMGSQWATMGKGLMKIPVCAEAIEKCHNILAEKGLDLKHIITTEDASVYDNILHCFVGIGAIQIALVDMLNSIGITPNGMVGHSVGELGCAYADGCLTLEQTILSSYYRGIASLEAELIHGSMAAVGLGYKDIKPLLPPEIDVACHNSATSSTLSGPTNIVKNFIQELQNKEIFARAVNVGNIAYHSRYIQPAAPILIHYLRQVLVDPKPRSSRWICSSVPEDRWDTELGKFCSAEYLTNNLLSEVLFEEASKHIPDQAVTIEIAPHGLLQAILRRSLSSCKNISLTQRGQGAAFTVGAVGKLYLAGLNPQVKELYPPVQMPVSIGTPFISTLAGWDHSETWHSLIDEISSIHTGDVMMDIKLNALEFKSYRGCSINGNFVLPTFAYLKLILETLGCLKDVNSNSLPVAFEELKFPNQLQLEVIESKTIHIQLQSYSGNFEISYEGDILASGRVSVLDNPAEEFAAEVPAPSGGVELMSDDVHRALDQYGYEYKKLFKGINKIKICPAGCVAKIQWADNWVAFGETLLQVMMMHTLRDWQKLKYPAAIQKIAIHPTTLYCNKTEMEAVYNSGMQTLTCGGIKIFKVKLSSSNINYNHNQVLRSVKFITHSNFKLQNIEQFIAVSLQWTAENGHSSRPKVAVRSGKIADIMKSLLHLYPKLILQEEDEYIRGSGKAYDLVVVTKEQDLETAISLIRNNGGFLLTMTEDTSWKVDQNLIVAGSQRFGNAKLVIYRKKTELQNVHAPQILHLNKNSSTWVQQIKKAAPCQRLFAVAELDERGLKIVLPFLWEVDNELVFEHLRFVFILDKNAPKFSLTNSFYHEQLYGKDLMYNVLQKGEWGNLFYLAIDSFSCVPEFTLNLSLDDYKLEFFGLNHGDLSSYDTWLSSKGQEMELGPVDFSGYSKSGQRIMGFAAFDKKLHKIIPDKDFIWEVPKSWTLQEAATVPFVYSIAYNTLFLKGQLRHGESILIHSGWSSIGQAAITLALDYRCNVYTSVTNDLQRRFIKQRFPQLLDSHIYSSESTSFELNLVRDTRGGVNVTVTCLSGEMLHSATRYLSLNGRLLVLGASDLVSNQSIGLYTFLGSRSMYGISIQNIFNLQPDCKEELHHTIKEKIQNGVIKPLQHLVYGSEAAPAALRSLADVSSSRKVILSSREADDGTVNLHNLGSDSQSFYLVVGSDIKQCLDVTEWLALRGVCHIAITTKSDEVPKIAEQRIKLLHTYYNTRVTLFETGAVNSASSISNLLQKASSHFSGPLEGIFILPLENGFTSSTVANLDVVSREISTVKHFVCLLMKNGWSTCERRHKEGYPALSVFWNQYLQKHFNLLHSMRILDSLLIVKDCGPLVFSEDEALFIYGGVVSQPEAFLPVSTNSLMDVGEDLLINPSCIEELLSLSPGAKLVKEVNPVFLIPGLQGPPTEILKPLAKNIMYPVFCVRPVHPGASVADTASHLVKLILDKQSSGPFNLIGVSFGGALTLELARLLESEGHKTRVVLIDGDPDIIQTMALQLKPKGSLEAKLVSTILQTKVADELHEITDLSKLLKSVVKSISSKAEKQLMTALTYLRNYLNIVLDYKPSGDLLNGEISLLRTSNVWVKSDLFGLDKFFKQPINLLLVEGDHQSLLSSPETSSFLNDFIL